MVNSHVNAAKLKTTLDSLPAAAARSTQRGIRPPLLAPRVGRMHHEGPVHDLAEGAGQLLDRDLLPLGLRDERLVEAASLALAQPRRGTGAPFNLA